MTHSLDSLGYLMEPNFHDGWLTGVSVGETSATLGLRTLTGLDYELLLSGVEYLVATDFREGNIICDVRVFRDRAVDADWLGQIFETPEHARQAGARIERGEATFIAVSPSYGCVVAAICREYELRAQTND